MKTKNILITLLFLVIANLGFTQDLAIGEWQIHSSYNSCVGVVEHDEKLYVACQYGMFIYDLNSKSLSKLSKVDGLSDNNFSAIGYNKSHGVIVIGYNNGSVDLIKDGTIYSISSIKRAQNILGTKRINYIDDYKDFVFLSTDFGIVKIDVVNPSIKETYKNLTEEGDVLKINQTLIQYEEGQDSLFLATNIGILSAPLNSKNLIDFSEWTLINMGDSTLFGENIVNITKAKGELYALLEKENQIYKKNKSNKWVRLPNAVASWDNSFSLFEINDTIYNTYSAGFLKIDSSGQIVDDVLDEIFFEPGYIFIDSKGDRYVIDFIAGFFSEKNNKFNYLNPNGPYTQSSFNLEIVNDELYVMPGGYASNMSRLKNNSPYFTYSYENAWTTFDQSNWELPVWDLSDVAYHKNRNEVYFASFYFGVMMKDSEGVHHVYTNNSIINTADEPFINPLTGSNVRVPSVETDRDGNVWLSNFLADQNTQFCRVNEDGTWTSFKIPNPEGSQISHLKFDLDNNIWAVSRKGLVPDAILAITKEGELKKIFTANDLFSSPRYVEIDKNGDVWVGTLEGIVIIKNENKMSNFSIDRPIIDGRYLLESLEIKSITVDGANRKWISTSDGVWVFNEDGTEEIHHFTRENSPLLSNDILDIAIHPTTGEVFIATSFGVASYRGESTESDEVLCSDPVKVFPNPVPAGYSGLVGINGVPKNAIVKIADISGKKVYEKNAYGGQAVWDTRDINGNKVKTGVYIAYISSIDAENTCVVKIAVVE